MQESTNSYSVTLSAMNSGIDITEILKDYNDSADASDVNTIVSFYILALMMESWCLSNI